MIIGVVWVALDAIKEGADAVSVEVGAPTPDTRVDIEIAFV